MHVARLSRQPVERVPGGHELERAWLREPHRRGNGAGEVETDDGVPELAGAAGRAAVDPPAEHQAAADTCAYAEKDEVPGDLLELLVVRLREC